MSSLPAFTPIGATATLAVTSASGNVALNRAGANQVLVLNLGDAEAFVDFGDSTQTATTTDMPVPAGGWLMLSIALGATHAAAITASGTATLRFTPGDGEFQGSAGAGGGGSSGNPSEVNLIQVGSTSVVTGGVNGLLAVAGNVAAGVADTGNGVKVAGVVSSSGLGPFSVGQRSDLWLSNNGAAVVSGVTVTGADGVLNTQISTVASTNSTGVRLLAIAPHLFDGTAWDRQRMNTPANGGAALTELGPYVFGRVTADGQIKSSAGFIHTITISPNGAVTAGVLTVYNNTAESGTVVASFSLPVTTFTPFSVTLDVACSTGIYVGFDATLANVSCTVSYR